MAWQKSILSAAILAALSLLVACAQKNDYINFYSQQPISQNDHVFASAETQPEIIELTSLKELDEWESKGYCITGTSSFYALWTPRTFAVDCARKYGASVILVFYETGGTEHKSMIVNMPTTSTTYHNGCVSTPNGMVTYSGRSTTESSVPIAINYDEQYYYQYAYFLAKRKNINSFGAFFKFPENIPGNTDQQLRIAAVITGSPAFKQGIRKGNVVKKINGCSIQNTLDAKDFINGAKEINSIEVSHE